VTALGTIFPLQEATISAKIAGQIKQMSLLRNKAVGAGEVLAVLESRDIQAQRAEAAAAAQEARANFRNVTGGAIPQTAAQDEKALRDARANVANARSVYERRLRLYEQGGISKKDLDASQLTLTTAENDLKLAEATSRLHATTMSPNDRTAAEARLKQAEDRLSALDTQLSYATIRAPFSGVISEQFQFQGEFASPGGKLLTIGDVSAVIVKAPVADTVAAQLKVGDPAKVLPQDLPGEEMTGSISLVSKSSDPQNRTVEVWVNIKNPGGRLRAHSAAKIVVSTQSASDVIVVPAAAVTLDAANASEGKVMVVDEKSIANETKVTVGIRTKDKMEITSGLQGGETVVIEGNYALPDGMKVEATEASQGDESDGKKDKEDKKPNAGDKQ
jgi:multidrug efflux pump subunit AcrA (membrane-fusion protein)